MATTERPRLGMNHPTVVPTNFDADAGDTETGPNTDDQQADDPDDHSWRD